MAYDEAWYGPQVAALTAPGVREVFKNQPPPGSLLLAPLVWLPYPTARLVWLLLNLGFLVVSLMLLARAVRWPARAGLWIAPFCLLYRPMYENLRQGQMYLWLLVWLCLALWALATGPARARRWQILLWGGSRPRPWHCSACSISGWRPGVRTWIKCPCCSACPIATPPAIRPSPVCSAICSSPRRPSARRRVAHLPALLTALTLTVQMTTLVITARGNGCWD
ncbi:MAG: DUF2029 domain-containing protein [Anaerolineae bacterium]|uniref:glycosyltransferase family 87 protein n=1 Tax=Candidatus Amarolinea dominans TaxID=3140696 RepID=UPI003134F75A|nr:DUF2029 domain-containing protein [Anaerolineae bacterium]